MVSNTVLHLSASSSLLEEMLTCSELHKGKLLLVVDVDIDHAWPYTNVQRQVSFLLSKTSIPSW